MTEDREDREPTLAGRPADVGARISAGVVDLLLLFVLGAALSLGPMLFGGLALPLVGAVAAIVVYTIAPCVLFRKTIGMKLFGLEIVSLNGRSADATELLFRELFGRGLFGAAYFASVAVGIAGWLSGSMGFFQPSGAGLAIFLVAALVTAIGVIGQLVALAAKDGRGLADLMAKTVVIQAGSGRDERSFEADLDDEERAIVRRERGRRIRNFVLFELGLTAAALLLPYALSRPFTGHEEFADRMEVKKAEREFKQDPTNTHRAQAFIDLLRRSGDDPRALEIEQQHQEAVRERESKQEAALRSSLAADAKDWDTLTDLIRLLERQGRTADAKAAFIEFAKQDGTADARTSLGIWLYDHDFTEEAVRELEAAVEAGAEGAGVHAYLGFALQERGDKPRARTAYEKALAIDPELYEARVQLEALDHEEP